MQLGRPFPAPSMEPGTSTVKSSFVIEEVRFFMKHSDITYFNYERFVCNK